MKLPRRIRGPRLGTKLLLLGLMLLVVPWLSYRQLVEMERLLVQGQFHAQLLMAEGISTLFNGREDLFNDLPVTIEDFETLFAHPLVNNVRLDGRFEDWGDNLEEKLLRFGDDRDAAATSFQFLLAERAGQLYAYLNVRDAQLVYRNPDYLRLDSADHVRVSFIRPDAEDGRFSLVFAGAGAVTAYAMDSDWRFATTGAQESAIQGYMEPVAGGWTMEFRLPLELLGSRRYFGVAVADVDDPDTREVTGLVQTLPRAGKESFDLVVLRSPEVLNIIEGLGYSGARILVIDAEQRVRAVTGAHTASASGEPPNPLMSFIREAFAAIRPLLHRFSLLEGQGAETDPRGDPEATASEIIAESLAGSPHAVRQSIDGSLEIVTAAHPIVSRDQVIGTVVVEQNIDDILSFQRSALEQVILVSVVSLFLVLIALVAFAGRLAWRIRNLRREASAAIDARGRLRTSTLRSEMSSGDEIGDLSRSVSEMLSKLHQHSTFLENMPRTLRHEINNPLNTLSTSLQNLAEQHPDVRDSKYLDSARRGLMRIGAIVQNLADAASLEESLETEELELVDIRQFLENYVANCRVSHPHCEFVYRAARGIAYARVSDHRIEQMLDKIIDNAIDFHRADSPVTVQLDTHRGYLQITVANRGPTLPGKSEESLFDSMVSHRGPHSHMHFGLGLYVVRVIAEHHGGHVRALNLADGSGVAVMVQLPVAADAAPPVRITTAGPGRAAAVSGQAIR